MKKRQTTKRPSKKSRGTSSAPSGLISFRIVRYVLLPVFVVALAVQLQFGTSDFTLRADVTSSSCSYNVSVSGSTALSTGGSNSYVVTVSPVGCTAATTATLAYSYPSTTPSPYPQCSFEGSGSISVPASGSVTNNLTCGASTSVAAGSYPYTIQVTSMSGNGTAPLTLNVTASAPVCSALNLTLDKASYTKGDMVNYTYSCTPAGSKAANTTVQVVKPDGTATTYNSGTNIDTASLGFSTSNLTAGSYFLKACLSSGCTTGVTSVAFTIVDTVSTSSCSSQTATSCSTTTGCYWATKKSGTGYCQSTSIVENCTDGIDNDGDEYIDKEDPGCGGTGGGTGTGTGGNTGGTTGTSPSACAVGAKCPSGSWCSNGQSFYYPTGEITCVAWSSDGTQPTAPAGTSECRPSDTNCVATGQIVTYVSGKWCARGMSYYSKDGKMTCVQMTPGSPAVAPAGYSSCRPDDASCIPAGSYGPSNGYCTMGMKFYQKVADTNPNNDIYCAEYSSTAVGAAWVPPTAPAGYGACDPTSTSCKEKGDTWTDNNSSYWCTNATKCTLAGGGGSCVGMNESCPTGSTVCPSGSTGCIEPGQYKTYSSSTSDSGNSYWCGGGGGMTFYSATQAYCAPKSGSTTSTMMWTAADVKAVLQKLGAGWGLCSPKTSSWGKCLEPGQTGTSSDWCGWYSPNYMPGNTPSGMSIAPRTCPSLDDTGTVTPPTPVVPPVPETCPMAPSVSSCPKGQVMVTTTGKCPTTYCKPEVPPGPIVPPVVPPVVPPGPIPPVEPPYPPMPPVPGMNQCRMIRDEIRPSKYEIRRVEQNLKYLPKDAEVPANLKTALMKATVVYDTLEKSLSQLTGKTCSDEQYKSLRAQTTDLYARMDTLRTESQNIEMYQRVAMMEKDLKQRVAGLERDQKRHGSRLDLSNEIGLMKSLLAKVVEARSNISTLDRYLLEDLEFDRQDIETAISEKYDSFQDEGRTSFVSGKIASIRDGITEAKAQMISKKIDGTEQCVKVSTLFTQVEDILAQAEAAYSSGDRDEASELLQKVDRFESIVRESAKQCGITLDIRDVRDAAVDALVQKVSDAVVSKTLAVLNEKIQKLNDQLSELTTASANLKKRVEESLTALNSIPKEQREVTQTTKEALIDAAKVTETLKGLTPALSARLRAAMESAAGQNFCGEIAADVQKAAESLKSKAENNDIMTDDINTFETYVASALKKNGDECYKTGAAQFKDMDMAAWYLPYFQNSTFFKGGMDTQGRPTGMVEPARQTLRAEALIAIERAFGLAGVEGSCELTTEGARATGVPDWARCAVNKAAENKVVFYGPMNTTVTRDEVSSWIVTFAGDRFPASGSASYTSGFGDIASCRSTDSVATLVANKIMTGFTGSGTGTWGCGKPLLRSELAAILARLVELLDLTK